MYKGNMEFRLNTTSLLELLEESSFVGGDRGKGIFEDFENIVLRKCNRNVFQRTLLLDILRWLVLLLL
jgi:hypothetical protein